MNLGLMRKGNGMMGRYHNAAFADAVFLKAIQLLP
jgi:hypothetical protein